MHWGPNGDADAFSDKSFIKIFTIVGMMIGLGIIIYISSISSLKTRAKLSIDSIDNSKKAHLHYLNMFGITFLFLNIGCEVLFIEIFIATLNASSVNTLILCIATIIIILARFRHKPYVKKVYSKRKETIASFCRCKRKTWYEIYKIERLSKIKMEVSLIFSCMNLKKLANWMLERYIQ